MAAALPPACTSCTSIHVCTDCPVLLDFKTLDVEPSSSLEQIRNAYKKLALIHHPDKNSGSDATFKEINNAFVNLWKTLVEGDPQGLCDSCRLKMEQTWSKPANEYEGPFIVSFKECSQCIVIHLGNEYKEQWVASCQELYGAPKDLGDHGLKFSCSVLLNSQEEFPEILPAEIRDRIHVTVYKTGTVLVQGNSYIWWHLEHFPFIVDHSIDGSDFPHYVRSSVIPPSAGAATNSNKRKKRGNPRRDKERRSAQAQVVVPPTSCIGCYSPDDDLMIQCSQCESWTHYSCCNLSSIQLEFVCEKDDRPFSCSHCTNAALVCSQDIPQVQSEPSDNYQEDKLDEPQRIVERTTSPPNPQVTEKNADTSNPKDTHPSKATNHCDHSDCETRSSQLTNRINNIELQLVKIIQSHSIQSNPQVQLETVKTENKLLKQEISRLNSTIKQMESESKSLRAQLAEKCCLVEKNLELAADLKISREKFACLDLLSSERMSKLDAEMVHLKASLKSCTEKNIKKDNLLFDKDKQISQLRSDLSDLQCAHTKSTEELQALQPTLATNNLDTHTEHHSVDAHSASEGVFVTVPRKRAQRSSLTTSPSTTRPTSGVKRPKMEKRPGGHLIVTSSLGKGLNWRGLRPTNHDTVKVRSIPGGTVKDVQAYILKSSELYRNDSISILVGTNDLNKNCNPSIVETHFIEMINTIRGEQPEAKILVHKLPPRLGLSDHNKNIEDTNCRLHRLCDSLDNVSFLSNDLCEEKELFMSDGVHLSAKGSTILAKSIKSSLCALFPSHQNPSAHRSTHSKSKGVRSHPAQHNSTMRKLLLSIAESM